MGKMELFCSLGIWALSMFWCFIPYNKSVIDQACSVKMAGYWPCSFFHMFMDLNFIFVPLTCKKRTWPISSHLDLMLGQ